jgi:hypothetical protein
MIILQQMKNVIRNLPDNKKYIELITAILSVPVLLTVLILNVHNLSSDKTEADTKKEGDTKQVIVTYQPENPKTIAKTADSSKSSCKEEVGPITITSPSEGETISESPVTVAIAYDKEEYCTLVWSYRINDGKWSGFDDKSIALYNLPKGEARLELRVKSIASGDEKTIKRNFTFDGPEEIDAEITPEPTSTPSANPQ